MGGIHTGFMRSELYSFSMDMKEFIESKGWNYTGQCTSCNGGMLFKHDGKPKFKIKLSGGLMIISENQNPLNAHDFKPIASGREDYQDIYKQVFGE